MNGGMISATTLIVANGIAGRITCNSKKLEKLIEDRPSSARNVESLPRKYGGTLTIARDQKP